MYYVLKTYSLFTPTVMFSTENKEDAFAYANLLNRNDENKHIVVQQIPF